MALTKADFAAQLLNELGLSKSMAKDLVELFFEEIKATLEHADPSKCPALVNSSFATKLPVLAGIRKPAKRYRSLPGVWSPSNPEPDLKQKLT